MLTPRLARVGWLLDPVRRRNAPQLVRAARFHAERLEDRFMMSADGPAAANPPSVAVFSAGDELTAAAAFVSRTTNETTIPVATNNDLQRFESTSDFEAWLLEAATAQYGHLFGQPTYHYGWNWNTIDYDALDIGVFAPVLRGSANVTFNGAHSATNVQVAGVDEADLVETDGEYLYIISGKDLVIVKAGVGEELQVVSRVQLDERPVGMYLSGDRLALVSSSATAGFGSSLRLGRPLIWGGMPLFTNDLTFSPQEMKPPTTTITLLDISDRAAPTLVHKTEMDGQLVTSRTVDGQLRLVLTNDMHLPMPIARPVEQSDKAEQSKQDPGPIADIDQFKIAVDMAWLYPVGEASYVYETRDEYLARVREEILDAVEPQIRSLSLDGSVISETLLLNPTEIYRPASQLNRHAVTVATFDLTSEVMGPAATATIMTNVLPQVYVDEDSIYVFAEQAPNQHLWFAGQMPTTGVWKFEIDNQSHDVDLVATGEFDGALLNQFAADEHDGRLRVVTEPRWSSVGQSLHVLEQVGDELKIVGSLDGIASNEQLYSVRFLENTVFFVTFRQTDPLFVVDLSDPVNPQLRGELHIPGFSDYLQPIDENHLLAIGRNADENTGQFQELQVSIFDVSDLTDPQLLHRYSFDGGRSTMTPATGDRWSRGDGDHHAVSYFAAEQIFALPIYTAEDIAWFSDVVQEGPMFESGQGGLQVFRIDLDEGFMPLAIIEHDTLVERSVQIGEHLYAISNGTLTVHELTDPGVRLGELDLAATGAERIALTFYEAAIETVSQTSDDALRDRPVSRAHWMPVAPERIPFKPAIRTVAFADIPSSLPLDDELVNAIAIDAASAAESSAASMVDVLPVENTIDNGEDSEQPARQLLARRGAFRPIAARLGS
ncbi:MAG TPA: beta-propeller domain-containing protein [Lacipirellulaceae bacterium]